MLLIGIKDLFPDEDIPSLVKRTPVLLLLSEKLNLTW